MKTLLKAILGVGVGALAGVGLYNLLKEDEFEGFDDFSEENIEFEPKKNKVTLEYGPIFPPEMEDDDEFEEEESISDKLDRVGDLLKKWSAEL